MPDDLPLWLGVLVSIITAISGGGVGAWLSGRGDNKKGDAALMDAQLRSEAERWNRVLDELKRLGEKSDRLESDLERERAERERERERFERRIAQLEKLREEDRERFAEYDETMRIIVAWADEISEPLPVELDI